MSLEPNSRKNQREKEFNKFVLEKRFNVMTKHGQAELSQKLLGMGMQSVFDHGVKGPVFSLIDEHIINIWI